MLTQFVGSEWMPCRHRNSVTMLEGAELRQTANRHPQAACRHRPAGGTADRA